MKKTLIIGLFWCTLLSAQRHELGVKAGFSNLVGDIGKTSFIQVNSNGFTKTPLTIGFSYKRNFNPHQGVKFSINYHPLQFNLCHTTSFFV